MLTPPFLSSKRLKILQVCSTTVVVGKMDSESLGFKQWDLGEGIPCRIQDLTQHPHLEGRVYFEGGNVDNQEGTTIACHDLSCRDVIANGPIKMILIKIT